MSRRRSAFDVVSSSQRVPRRSGVGDDVATDEATSFRRLAAQLGLSRQLQRVADDDDDDDGGNDDDDDGRGDGDTADSRRRRYGSAYDYGERDQGDDDDEEEDDDRVAEGLESPLTPLRSDISASESLSSDLSLPRSFGNYDVMRTRKPPFDDELQRRTQRNTERNATLTSGGVATVAVAATGGSAGRHDMMRKFYEAQVEKIRAQLAVVSQAQHHIETTLQGERQQWAKKLLDMETTLEDERADYIKERDSLHAQLRQIRERVKMEKSHLSDLQISDALAEQLSRQDADDLSVKEFVQLHVHRKVRHLESELETARKEMESLRHLCANYKSHATNANDEVAQLTRVADANELRLQHELELSEASRTELENQIQTLCGQLEVFKDAQAKSELESSRRPASVDVYTENEKLKSELQLADDRLRVTVDKTEELRKQLHDVQQQVSLLSADKAFLQDAKRQLEDHEMRLMAKNKELQTKADFTAAAQLAGANELSKVQEETRLLFEKQLAGEIDKFMEMSKREIDTIRSNSQMVYERENRLLKEARDDALKQIDVLQTRLQSVQSSLDEKILESTRMDSAHSTALSTVRNDFKMKHFEMNQLSMSLEERSTELRTAKLEIEMLQQKVEVHKEEFARLESTSTMRIAQLESSLETERRRLEEYDRLEVDLDDAVLQTGAIDSGSLDVTDTVSSPKHQLSEVMATFSAIPSSTKRRFHQSVQLAQRVVKYQKESIELQRQLDVCTADKRQLEHELADMKRQLANLHQPQSYLIDKLGRKDADLLKLQRLNEQLQAQLTELRAEYQQTATAKMALQAQLQQVLARREELHGLKRTVEALRKKLDPVDDFAVNPGKVQPSPVMLKNPPSPHVMSQMLRPPPAQSYSAHASPVANPAGGDPVATSGTPPKWYTKLRSS